jgi:hypothetical protein
MGGRWLALLPLLLLEPLRGLLGLAYLFWYGLRCLPCLLFGGELLLNFEGDGVGIHFVCLGCGAENLSSV